MLRRESPGEVDAVPFDVLHRATEQASHFTRVRSQDDRTSVCLIVVPSACLLQQVRVAGQSVKRICVEDHRQGDSRKKESDKLRRGARLAETRTDPYHLDPLQQLAQRFRLKNSKRQFPRRSFL